MSDRFRTLLAVLVLVVSGCTAATDSTTTTVPPETTPTAADPTTSTTAAAVTTAAPEAGLTIEDQLAWILGLLDGAELTAAEYEARFAQVFEDQVPYEDFALLIDQISGGLAGWSLVDTETSGSTNLVVIIAPAGGEPTLRLLLNIDGDHRIDGLFLQPAEPPALDDPPETYDQAFQRLTALGTAGVIVAETTDGSCVPVAEVLGRTALPLGSMFKIYVLGAVADGIAAGEIAWDDQVTLTEEDYSMPSGITQNEEPGSALAVRELARRMIEISDNTATDHLISLVGRGSVEAIQQDMGHSNPMLNLPFLKTRELFQLKLGGGATLDAYTEGDVATRRQVLAELAGTPLPDISLAVGWTEPVAVTAVEWFASPVDLCRAWTYLAERSTQTGLSPVGEIVSANPGIPDETGAWDEVWFKGGSEPGVLGVSWYLTTSDDRSFVVAGSVVNETEAFDQTEAVLLVAAIRDLLAMEMSG